MSGAGPRQGRLAYRLVRGLARLLLGLFYRRVEAVGLERLPPGGPLIVAANHHNALVDAMLLISTVPRPLTVLATAPLFRNPLIGPFLGLLGAVPVRRRQEYGADPARNESLFAAATATLAAEGAILIFPEGESHAEPSLLPARTGAARMLLAAERVRPGVSLLPVGLVYQDPGTFRTGWALVQVGEPVPAADCAALYPQAPEEAVRRLTLRLGQALRGLIVETRDRHALRLVELAEAIWREQTPGASADPAARARWRQRAARAYRHLLGREPERLAALRTRIERYAKDLEVAGLGGPELGRRYAPGPVLGYALRQLGALLLGLPLASWGLAVHALPYWLTRWGVRLIRPEPDEEASYKLSGGALLYPLAWLGEGWLAWRVGGGWLLALFLLALLPAGFFALAWGERLGRLVREARGLVLFLVDRDFHRHLGRRREAIMEELGALERLVPEAVLAGREEDPR